MANIISMLFTVYDCILGFVVAFFKELTGRDNHRDHGGYKSFIEEKTKSVALQVRLQMHSWLSGLQHSPTV